MAEEENPAGLIAALSATENRLRQDSQAMESRLRDSLSQMVTKDLFEAEQKYQAERHQQAVDRIREERERAEAAEREERSRAEAAERDLAKRIDETEKAQGDATLARKTAVRRLWIGIGSGLTALAGIVTALAALFHH